MLLKKMEKDFRELGLGEEFLDPTLKIHVKENTDKLVFKIKSFLICRRTCGEDTRIRCGAGKRLQTAHLTSSFI